MSENGEKFRFAIDRGGTFTDVFAKCPGGKIRVLKLLSEDPQHYKDAPTEGIRRILQEIWNCVYFPNQGALKEYYADKSPVAHALCVKHLEHRHQLHEKRRIDDATTDSKITESFEASLPERPSVKLAPTRWIPNDMNPFIVRPVQSQVEEKQPIEYLTEMRQVTIQFINIVPTTFQETKLVPMVNKAYQLVCKVVSKMRGVVNKVSLFDKDCMILVLFGLRGIEHEVESQNALKAAFAIRKSIRRLTSVKSISIGVTNGWVYCGVVGHPFRREYTVIGGSVNKAARIMCAYEGKVTCDHETYKSCKLSSLYFQVQSALKLKGIADAGHIFEYNEDFDKMAYEDKQVQPLVGRELEVNAADLILTNPEKAGWSSVCFKGESKMGKTKLLQEIHKRYVKKYRYVCSLVLNEALQRPYYTVATIYQQLYDINSKHHPERLVDLPRHLWDWTEVLQASKSNLSIVDPQDVNNSSEENVYENFIEMLGKDIVLVFIDNVQFMDNKSFEIIIKVLPTKLLRLVCGGCFEANNTWNTMWKFNLSKQIKVFAVGPLPSKDMALLVCNFLNVKGISKKLVVLVNKTCEGRPGWVQACVLKMINNGELEVKYAATNEIEYVFLNESEDKGIVLVAGFSKKYVEHSEETSTAVTLDLFDSFSPYQQLIIKTAAVLGELFTRTSLIVLLKYPNESMLAAAIKTLFEEEVFDCASRYVNSGGLMEKQNVCLCYMEDDEINTELDMPRYAFCKVLHFKSRNIKVLAYELLPLNQKKELHLRITDLLENQNNSCPSCMRDNSASIISVRRFKELIKSCHDQSFVWADKYHEKYCSIEEYKQLILEYVHNPPVYQTRPKIPQTFLDVPKRRVWDPTTCFCLEILMKVYRDLIHHSHCAQHLGKKIFFMVEYCSILFMMSEFGEVLTILHEANELCMVQTNKAYVFTDSFKTLMMGTIQCLLGYSYLRMGNVAAAKNHALLSLRQYNVPLISFKYSLPHMLLNRAWFFRVKDSYAKTRPRNIVAEMNFAMCLGLISNIYAVEGCWSLAKQAILRSVACLRRTNPNVEVLCDIYSSAVYLYSLCGDKHMCEKLERCINNDLLKYYSNNITRALHSVTSIISILFLVKALAGSINEAVQLGFRTVDLALNIQAYFSLIDVLPTMTTILIYMNRIDDAVYKGRILQSIGKRYQSHALTAYYSFCIQLILETNFYLEPIEEIGEYAAKILESKRRHSTFANKLIVCLYCYYLRYMPSQAESWKQKLMIDSYDNTKIINLLTMMRYTECLLLECTRLVEQKTVIDHTHAAETTNYLNKLKGAQKKWPLFRPRYLHLKAYHARLQNKTSVAAELLRKANKVAVKQGNILEECWTMLHSTCWFGEYMFEKRTIRQLDWKLAKTYTPLQWCQILYALPTY